MSGISLRAYGERVRAADPMIACGKIVNVIGLTLQATGPRMNIGDLCFVQQRGRGGRVPVEVVGFRDERILLMPLGSMEGIGPGDV